MKNHARRIEKIEAELNPTGLDEVAREQAFERMFPVGSLIFDEFYEKHQDDPDFVKEQAEGKFSDKTINQMVDYYLRRLPEIREDPRHAHLFPPNEDQDKIKQWVSSWKNYWKARDEEKLSVS